MAKQAISGVVWSSVQRFGTMILSFVSNLVLTRLLTPDDFGSVGMLLFFITLATTFIDSGLGAAVIQKSNPTKEDYSTVFYSNIFLSAICYGGLYVAAPYIAGFYHIPFLTVLLRAEGLVLFLNAFTLIQTSILRKRMEFKVLALANIFGNIAGTLLGIGLALYGAGVWSLVGRMLVVSFFTAVWLWRSSDWKPGFIFSFKSFKELFSFGSFMLLASVVISVSNNVQTLIIGRLFSSGTLGYYTQAKQLSDVPALSISSIIGQVAYPMFANIKEDKEAVGNKLLKWISVLAYLNSALMVLLIILARPLILFLYGERWSASTESFQILCFGGLFLALQDINYYVIAAFGASRKLFVNNFYQTVVGIFLKITGGWIGGINGLLWAMVLCTFIFYCVYAYLSSKLCNMSLFAQLWRVIKQILLAAVSGVLIYCLLKFVFPIDSITSVYVIQIILISIFYSIVFLFFSFISKSKELYYLAGLVQKKFSVYRKN